MKCPQLSKPEATAARNQNSIGDRTEKEMCVLNVFLFFFQELQALTDQGENVPF